MIYKKKKKLLATIHLYASEIVKEEKSTYLAFAESPEIRPHAHQVVQARIRGLVHEQAGERGQRQDGEAELDGSVDAGAGEQRQGPLQGDHGDAEDEVDDLEDGEGLDGDVERLGQEVPEDLGPDEALDGGADLVCVTVLVGYVYRERGGVV